MSDEKKAIGDQRLVAGDERRESDVDGSAGRGETGFDLKNTTRDDISAVVGFSATLRLSAWFGDLGNLYIPAEMEEAHTLVKLLGMSAARRLSTEFGGQYLNVPRIKGYEEDVQRCFIGKMAAMGCSTREITHMARVGERRVQQICRDLEAAGLIPVMLPKKVVRGGTDKESGFWGVSDEPDCNGV